MRQNQNCNAQHDEGRIFAAQPCLPRNGLREGVAKDVLSHAGQNLYKFVEDPYCPEPLKTWRPIANVRVGISAICACKCVAFA